MSFERTHVLLRSRAGSIISSPSPSSAVCESNPYVAEKDSSSQKEPFTDTDSYASHESYAALLAKLPCFEPYSYPPETTDEVNNDPLSLFNRDQSIPEFGNSDGNRHVCGARSVDIRNAYGISNLSNSARVVDSSQPGYEEHYEQRPKIELVLLRMVRNIGSTRDRLLQAQLRVETIENHLAKLRKDQTKYMRMLVRMFHRMSPADARIQEACWKILSTTQEILKRQASEEDNLVFRQRHVTLIQQQLKISIDDLYASFSGGAKLGDSEDEFEDEILRNMESRRNTIDPRHVDHLTNDMRDTLILEVELAGIEHTDARRASGDMQDQAESAGILASDYIEPLQRVCLTTVPHSQPKNKTSFMDKNKFASSPPAPATADLLGIGAQYYSANQDIQSLACAVGLDGLLSTSSYIQAVRWKDLKLESSVEILCGTQADDYAVRSPRSNIFPGFAVVKALSYHTRDSIVIWGSSMSQNTLVDLSRTALCYEVNKGDNQLLVGDLVKIRDLSSTTLSKQISPLIDFLRALTLSTSQVSLPRENGASSTNIPAPDRSSTPVSRNLEMGIGPSILPLGK